MTQPGRSWRPWQILLLGLLLLLLIAMVDLGMQEVYHRYLWAPTPQPTWPSPSPSAVPPSRSPIPRPSITPAPRPSPAVYATVPLSPTSQPTPLSFPEQRFQEALDQLAFRQLLLKAALQLLRAEDYLSSGEMKQVERELIAVSTTLDQAAHYANESLLDTIGDLQRDLSLLREDLYLRPERLQEGMRRLWQRIDLLIGE
ncbi:MAG: hypothetical protein JXA37_09480 [Chloroflexia bacterium]|nr:hypothetical protein [Chloroflexia bacterium]